VNLTIVRERPAPVLRIKREPVVPPGQLWNLHSHSSFSHKDALPSVKAMVDTVVKLGQPALGLTDHGNMAGAVQLYQASRKNDILPFPGTELYVVTDREAHVKAMSAKGETPRELKRHHMCVVAYTSKGYENLVGLSTLSHRNFFNKPIVDHNDLATLGDQGLLEGIAATSGCYFGLTSQAIVRGDIDGARSLLWAYAQWFPKFYVELQNHNIDHEEEGWNDNRVADTLLALADELGLPAVLTQDAHYCEPADKPTHEILKRIVAFGPEADDAVFPGDGFHLADDAWFVGHHSGRRLAAGAAGLADLLASHDLKIPELDSYSYNIPFTVADPDRELSEHCQRVLREKLDRKEIAKAHYDRCIERLNDELEIVRDTGMAGYLQLVGEVTDWCRANRVFYQARGSASGSMICYLRGITQLDPIKWHLPFERFISRDRTKPPDIDLDVEHDRRKDLIAWLRTRFAVQQIGTHTKFSLKRQTAEWEVEDWDDEAKGSLRVAYFARMRASGVENIPDWKDVPEQDKRDLYTLDAAGTLSSYGVHAAGLIVTTTQRDIDRLIPLQKVASSDTMVSQYDMHDTEALGAVKLDVLGLRTLTVLNRAMTFMGRDVLDGLDWVPLTDKKTFQSISRGDTDGVFQLEGGTARRGCKELKPTKIDDIVAAMALFRPATMESGATKAYIERKNKEQQIPRRHELIEKHTKSTYGIMLFQDQVVTILRDLGMSADRLTDFLKAIKASQKDEMEKAREVMDDARLLVQEMAYDRGMSNDDVAWLWSAILGFVTYGFNQSHSSAYGLTAYRCAYLINNEPLAYHAGLLAVAAGNKKKEPAYKAAARRRGVKLLRADINLSGVTYAPDPRGNGVRMGLLALDGVGEKQAVQLVSRRPEGGWQTLEQLCRDVYVKGGAVTGIKPYLESQDHTVGTIHNLWKKGALECFTELPPW
jgi:DNA polymerase-3 subunit alpha